MNGDNKFWLIKLIKMTKMIKSKINLNKVKSNNRQIFMLHLRKETE